MFQFFMGKLIFSGRFSDSVALGLQCSLERWKLRERLEETVYSGRNVGSYNLSPMFECEAVPLHS